MDKFIKTIYLSLLISVWGCGQNINSNNESSNDKIESNNSTLLNGQNEYVDESQNTVSKIDSIKNVKVPDESNWQNSIYVDSLKMNLDSCYKFTIYSSTNPNSFRETGVYYYSKAKDFYFKLVDVSNNEIVNTNKARAINEIMDFYKQIFYQAASISNNISAELEYYNKNLALWPNQNTQMETDYEKNIFRVFIGKDSGRKIRLPQNHKWCLWEIGGVERITLEGFIPNFETEFLKNFVYSTALPVYLGDEKTYTIWNTASIEKKDIQVIFRACEKQ